MSRVVIIGGSGHVGTYLVPRLVEAGFEVVNISRGAREPYQPHAAWKAVRTATLDRDAEEKAGTFGRNICDLKPDIVIDMICFRLDSAKHLVEALRGQVQHFLSCGTIWVHGPSVEVPASESQPRRPFGEYGTQKAAIEAFLLDEARRNGFPATIAHPGHIVGPGWAPLNPAGHFNPDVFSILARGEELALPNFGMETVHHVHADDVAQMFIRAIFNWSASVGEAFHTVSPAAISLRGYAEAVAGWFGREPKLVFLPWPEWKARQSEEEAQATWEHISRSPNSSIEKARRLLGYEPRYTSLEAVYESVTWLIEKGIVETFSPVS
ncbi:NAD(P)-dependent oxidoreductase [Mesorhizobium sp. BAC0120]|uniref:NAD-dependent epimerase/dehydratase family protein n=1 Tax=Mesorhizobium sp. BAC0120 TaxID=3090670 RepID=UPI00298C4AD6|nr:NAD(P)-dependent oxidoreductase [Mesorhizobium sp. BAC0120]MDW6022618.1 NAD(P)-dependent oxidoreductase [Mesorhizobium sp. BAC0120]